MVVSILATLTLEITEASAPTEDLMEITIKDYARFMIKETWSEDEWESFDILIQKESSWNPSAQNPNSTAFGLGQFLNSTWNMVGCVKTTNERKQIDCTILYIKKIYGSPQKALKFHLQHNWY